MQDFGLYMIITKPVKSYREIAEIAVKQKVSYLQLREKHLNDRELIVAAETILQVTRGTNTKFVINDRADLAKIVQADCLHLGQTDLTLTQARSIVGNEMEIGLSTHSVMQAEIALEQNPAYIGYGPIYPTPTKAIADPAVGLDNLREVVEIATEKQIPVVAIGGIFTENLAEIIQAGAKNFCLVRNLMSCNDLEEKILEIQQIWRNNK